MKKSLGTVDVSLVHKSFENKLVLIKCKLNGSIDKCETSFVTEQYALLLVKFASIRFIVPIVA